MGELPCFGGMITPCFTLAGILMTRTSMPSGAIGVASNKKVPSNALCTDMRELNIVLSVACFAL